MLRVNKGYLFTDYDILTHFHRYQQPTFAISLACVFSDTTCKNMVDGKINAIKVPIVAPVNASTNSTMIQINKLLLISQGLSGKIIVNNNNSSLQCI